LGIFIPYQSPQSPPRTSWPAAAPNPRYGPVAPGLVPGEFAAAPDDVGVHGKPGYGMVATSKYELYNYYIYILFKKPVNI